MEHDLETDIPKMPFIDNMEKFIDDWSKDSNKAGGTPSLQVKCQRIIDKLSQQYERYKTIESSFQSQKQRCKERIPILSNTLQLIAEIETKKNAEETMYTNVQICDNLYASAEVPPTDKIALWLGADVLLEYTIDEAKKVIGDNLNEAQERVVYINKCLDYLRDQCTMAEVNIARIYNWHVQRRKEIKPGDE